MTRQPNRPTVADPVDFESATVLCGGGHDASIEVRQSYDRHAGPTVPSVIGSAADVALACGWRRYTSAQGEHWLCVLCVATTGGGA